MKYNHSIFKTFFLSLCILANTHFAYGQTASILPPAKTTFLDSNGKPLTSGTVDFYIPGQTVRKTTWQDAAETTPNTNPVILDAAGRGLILGSGSYRQVVKDRLGNLIWDQVTSSTGSGGGGGTTATGDGDLVGTIKPWAGMSAPNQYLFTYGQQVSRTTYSVLFTAITSAQPAFCTSGNPTLTGLSDTTNFWIGMTVEATCLAAGSSTIISKTSSTVTLAANPNVTSNVTATFFPWGNGNGSTTFNIPDFRGFAIAGNNNMGGVANSVLTTQFFGAATPNATGAAGGNQSTFLTTTNLPSQPAPSGTVASSITFNSQILTAASLAANTGATSSGNPQYGNANTLVGAVTSTFTGSALTGQNATLFSIVQPTKTSNYIIKVTPDSNSATASGVTSLGGMTGDIACGTGLLCTGNNISVVTAAISPAWYGGQVSLYPNPTNNPGSAPANQLAQDGFGNLINISSTTTGGLGELETQAATTGWPMVASQFGVTSSGTNAQFIGMSTTWTTHPRGVWSINIDDATVQCSFSTSSDCFVFDSAEIGKFNLTGQVVYGGTGNSIHINPTTITPNDHFKVFSLNDFSVTTTVAVAGSEAAIKIDPTATGSLGIQQNVFNFKEVNNGIAGIKVMNPSAISGGLTPVFSHNVITANAIHGQGTAGVQVGQSTTRQAQMGGNVWTTFFNSSAQTDAFVTYEHNSLHIVGFDPTNTLTNGLHYKSGATNNVAIILDKAGATNPIVDDNIPASASTGNIIIGDPTCGITIGGFCAALQNSNNIFANVEVNNLQLKGSSTGFTTFTSSNSGASNFTLTVPANTGTLAELNLAQSWTAVQSFGANDLLLSGVTGSTQCLQASTSGVVTGTGSVCGSGSGSGTVTSIATTSPITGGTITTTGTIACATCVTSAAALTLNNLVIGSGLQASATTTTGANVITALGVAVGSAGAFITFNGAGGTPSSMVGTNISGTAASLTAGTVTTNANLTGVITSSGNATSIASQTGTGTKFVVDTSPTIITPTFTTSLTSPIHYGGTAAGSTLILEGTSNASPSGDYVQITSTGATALTFGKICAGNTGFAGFAVGNTGQADCTHYSYMGDGTNSYFNSPSGAGITSFRINNGEFMRLFASSGFAISSSPVDPGSAGLYVGGQTFVPNITTSSAAQTGTVCWTTGTGKFTVDTTVGCLTSIMSAKNITERLSSDKALNIITSLNPFAFKYKTGYGDSGKYEQFGFGAEEVALVDERLVGRDPEGKLQGVRYQELTAVLSGAIKNLDDRLKTLESVK